MLWVETDLEPDDILALYMQPLSTNVDYYVVGEGNANIKYNRMKRYAQLLGNEKAVIIKRIGSSARFPEDGQEFEDLETSVEQEDYLTHFKKFANSDHPTMFSLKAMRELINEYLKDKSLIIPLLSNITLYVYGGANFRFVGDTVLELLKHFKEVHLYESYYATGENNSITKDNFPELYQLENEYLNTWKRSISLWNTHLLRSMQNRLKKTVCPHKIKRLSKIVANIQGHQEDQLLMADFAMIASIYHATPSPITNLRFENNYTVFDWAEQSSIKIYYQLNRTELKSWILESLTTF
jgi:hypothetical protein